jgi:hypothetical protein
MCCFDISRWRTTIKSKPPSRQSHSLTTFMSKRIAATVAITAFIAAGVISLLAKPPQSSQPGAVVSPISPPIPSSGQPTIPVQGSGPNTTASSTVDTSNWLTYRNLKYSYSFKYPPGYSVTTRIDYADYPDEVQDIADNPTSSPKDAVKNLWAEVDVGANPQGMNSFPSEADFVDQARQNLRANCFFTPSTESEERLTDIVKESASTTQSGIFYYEAYYNFISLGNGATGSVGSGNPRLLGVVGPFYQLDVVKQSHGSAKFLNISPAGVFKCTAAPSPQPESPAIRAFVDAILF